MIPPPSSKLKPCHLVLEPLMQRLVARNRATDSLDLNQLTVILQLRSHLAARRSARRFINTDISGATKPSMVRQSGVKLAWRRSQASEYLVFFSLSAVLRTASGDLLRQDGASESITRTDDNIYTVTDEIVSRKEYNNNHNKRNNDNRQE